MSVHVFLSHSHKDRKMAHSVKEALEQFGFKAFLAHDDIRISQLWRKEILRNLRACDVFIPILTKAFTESDWTDQEAGYALGRRKVIAPLKVDVDPYGFIGESQALRLRQRSLDQTCWAVMESLRDQTSLGGKVTNGVIKVFLQSGTFDEAWDNVKKLMKFRPFSGEQLTTIVEGSSRNQNIYGCRRARPIMQGLLEEARGKVSRGLIAQYRKAVKGWPY